MKNKNIFSVMIIVFDTIIILLVKYILSKKTKNKVLLYYHRSNSGATYKKIPCRKYYGNSNRLSRGKRHHISLKTSNDEIIELIKQFFGGNKK